MNIEAYILIGGRSSRMGRDKARLELCGFTLSGLAVDIVRKALRDASVTLVAGHEGQFFAIDSLVGGVPVIYDMHEGRGPVGGIHAALSYARSEWVLVVACDMPFLSAELIGFLKTCISEDLDAIVPRQADGRLQALCGFYNVERCLRVFESGLAQGRSVSMLEMLSRIKTRAVEVDEYGAVPGADRSFTNINTQADLNDAESDILAIRR